MSGKKKLLLIIISILGIILMGIGLGYGIYKLQESKYEKNDTGERIETKENLEKEETTDEENIDEKIEQDSNINSEVELNNEIVKQLDKYVQSITQGYACINENYYKELFSGDKILISELYADIQFGMVSNYFLENYEINNMEYYSCDYTAAFDKSSLNLNYCNEWSTTPNARTGNLYKESDLESLFKHVFGPNTKYYYGITSTLETPYLVYLNDNKNYMLEFWGGGCGPSFEIHNNFLKYEETTDSMILYYGFGYYNFEESKYYTGNMNNLILLESNVDYDSSETIGNKSKDNLTQFKVTFKKDSNGSYYYYSIEWV